MHELSPDDQQQIREIFKANQKLPGAPSWNDQQLIDEALQSRSVVTRNPSGEVLAFILYRKTPDAYEISYLATNMKEKRKGLMGDLLRRLIEDATRNMVMVWLEVHEHNAPARSLYEKLGFKVTGTRPKYYSDGGAAVLYNYE
jgi:[ribosomal protein S18]-alanine N-acetyltransferase